MTYNIFVSRPLKCHLPMQAGGYYLLCYYILFCTKPTYLTARAWPFSIDFNDNNFGCGTKKCMRARDGKLLYYKSWPNMSAYDPHAPGDGTIAGYRSRLLCIC